MCVNNFKAVQKYDRKAIIVVVPLNRKPSIRSPLASVT